MRELLEILKELPEEKQKAVLPMLLAWFNDGCVGGLWQLEKMLRSVGLTLTK